MTNKKILIVEDDAQLRNALREVLALENFITIEAVDGEEGLKLALKQNPNLILLDILMPKMDGMTMLKKLRANREGKNIPVIVLTNLSDPAQEWAADKYNVTDYLVKADWDFESLIKVIRKKIEK